MPRRYSARPVRVCRTLASRQRTRSATGTAIPGTATARRMALGANPCNVGSLAGGTGCGLNAAAVGVAARGRPDGDELHAGRGRDRLRGVGQRRRLGRPELRVRRHGRRRLRLPDARRVHRRLGRQRDRLVRAGQHGEPPHHLRRGRRGGRDGAGVHPDQLRLLLPEHLGQRRGLLHAVAVQHARRNKQQFAAFQRGELHHPRRRGHLLERADADVAARARPTTTTTT